MSSPMPNPADLTISAEPIAFKHGKGRMLDVSASGDKVRFTLAGRLVFGMGEPFSGSENTNRRGVTIRFDEPADAETNAGMSEWFAGLDARLLEHVGTHVGAIFPGTVREVIDENGFSMVERRYGGQALKLRVDLESTAVLFVDPAGDPAAEKLVAKRVPPAMVGEVLTRDAHAKASCELAFVWLDDTMTYGVTVSATSLLVTPAPPRAPRTVQEMENDLGNIVLAGEVKAFPGGAGRYVGVALDGQYPTFMLCDSVGHGCDGLVARFKPSAGKDAPPDSDKLSVPLAVRRGSPLHNVVNTLDAMFMAQASMWFPGKGPAALRAMYKSPLKDAKENYDPMLYVKLHRESVAGREATRAWTVPAGAPPMRLADALTTEHGYAACDLRDIPKDATLAVVVSFSCVWLQSATFGWSVNATDIFVHPGEGGALEIGGRPVQMAGEASADEIDAFLGRGCKRPREPEGPDDYDAEFGGGTVDAAALQDSCRAPCDAAMMDCELPMSQRSY